VWITSSLEAAKAPTHIALGNFDGVHLGHQQVMAQILCTAAEQVPTQPTSMHSIRTLHTGDFTAGYSLLPEDEGLAIQSQKTARSLGETAVLSEAAFPTVVTFSPHPHEYFSGTARPLLTPVAEKAWQLAQLGVQQLVMLPFNQALAELSPQDFVEKILIQGLKAQRISVGGDFHFGKGRSGNSQNLADIAGAYGVPVIQVPLKHAQGDRISSSRIRTALQSGEPEIATRLLGRPYTLTGRVVKGQQLGRTIGFPTANLQVPQKKYLPRTGVYSVRVYGAKSTATASRGADEEALQGVMNIGNRPTVDGQSLSIEVHILGWDGDLYDKTLTVSVESFVRAEQKFESLDQLKAQIEKDCEQAIATLTKS